ncbi:MAG: PKD domain-containing protein [Candidatus Thermoplasmatota archaeon]
MIEKLLRDTHNIHSHQFGIGRKKLLFSVVVVGMMILSCLAGFFIAKTMIISTTSISPPKCNSPPIAYAGENKSVYLNVTTVFKGFAYDMDGTVVLYQWDFDGDGEFEWENCSNAKVGHKYNKLGTFSAFFRVIDNDGAVGIDTIWVTVVNVSLDLNVYLQKKDLRVNESVNVSIVLHNGGPLPIWVCDLYTSLGSGFMDIIIVSSSGKIVPKKRLPAGWPANTVLLPSEYRYLDLDLQKLYDFDFVNETGRYNLWVEYSTVGVIPPPLEPIDGPWEGRLVSDIQSFTIT